MTTTPTAEEVLELYREFQEAVDKWSECEDENFNLLTAQLVTRDKFEQAYQQWQAAQGPYTFDWFCGRFREYVHCNLGSLFAYIDGVELEIKGRSIFFDHPQRCDIETLVRLLSGDEP